MGTPHKHAELIKAWADGAEIQSFDGERWRDVKVSTWRSNREYRIKPKEIEAVYRCKYAFKLNGIWHEGTRFFTDAEFGQHLIEVKIVEGWRKLTYTKTEFPE